MGFKAPAGLKKYSRLKREQKEWDHMLKLQRSYSPIKNPHPYKVWIAMRNLIKGLEFQAFTKHYQTPDNKQLPVMIQYGIINSFPKIRGGITVSRYTTATNHSICLRLGGSELYVFVNQL